MEIRPAMIDGNIMSSGDTEPRSLLILITVIGTSCSMDMDSAINIHIELLAWGR